MPDKIILCRRRIFVFLLCFYLTHFKYGIWFIKLDLKDYKYFQLIPKYLKSIFKNIIQGLCNGSRGLDGQSAVEVVTEESASTSYCVTMEITVRHS